jgi:hypothetical protein
MLLEDKSTISFYDRTALKIGHLFSFYLRALATLVGSLGSARVQLVKREANMRSLHHLPPIYYSHLDVVLTNYHMIDYSE